jgi:hypothetical protein
VENHLILSIRKSWVFRVSLVGHFEYVSIWPGGAQVGVGSLALNSEEEVPVIIAVELLE